MWTFTKSTSALDSTGVRISFWRMNQSFSISLPLLHPRQRAAPLPLSLFETLMIIMACRRQICGIFCSSECRRAYERLLIFRYHFKLQIATFMSIQLFLNESMQNYCSLHVFDLDRRVLCQQVFQYQLPQLFSPNERGYLIFADCRSPSPQLSGSFKLRLMSHIALPEMPLELSLKPNIMDTEEVYVPNKLRTFFRFFHPRPTLTLI